MSDAAQKNGEKNAPHFTIWQDHLANGLGISEEELRRRRDKFLKQDEHFQKNGRRILYSLAGQIKLHQTLCIDLGDVQAGQTSIPQSTSPQGGVLQEIDAFKPKALLTLGSSIVTLRVWRSAPQILNRNIVEAYVPGTEPLERKNILRVRVSNNINFIPGMELPARCIQADLFECTRRAPRFRGRW